MGLDIKTSSELEEWVTIFLTIREIGIMIFEKISKLTMDQRKSMYLFVKKLYRKRISNAPFVYDSFIKIHIISLLILLIQSILLYYLINTPPDGHALYFIQTFFIFLGILPYFCSFFFTRNVDENYLQFNQLTYDAIVLFNLNINFTKTLQYRKYYPAFSFVWHGLVSFNIYGFRKNIFIEIICLIIMSFLLPLIYNHIQFFFES